MDTSPTTASEGENAFEAVMYAVEAVRGGGYSPTIAALSPGDALLLALGSASV